MKKFSEKGIETSLLALVREFLHELEAERAISAISLEASLARDLGIDSLGKVELIHRIEETYELTFTENETLEADTLDALVKIILKFSPKEFSNINKHVITPTLDIIKLDLSSAQTLPEVLQTYAKIEPHRPHLYLQNEWGEETIISYHRLYNEAEKIAKGLRERDIHAGETIAIMLPNRATLSGTPNFAYELCIKKVQPKDIERLDLSSWRFAFSGAEAINPQTLKRFHEKFAPYGFKFDSFAPVYGLAESTVGLTFPTCKRAPKIDRVHRDILEKTGKTIPVDASLKKNYLEFVGCGTVLSEHEIRIVDDDGHVLEDRMIGDLQFRGLSAMQGLL